MEATSLSHAGRIGLAGRSPLLRLQSDERLIGLIRRGNGAAFEVLFQRYHSRLLAFCRHMLASREDAEDILQEVFAAAYNAILADTREINARPWLYRIARNRCLNHLRRPVPTGQDSMDIHPVDNGLSTAERVQKREEFRNLLADVGLLPETQRTALLLREIDALSYEEIAQAMSTTIPSVKSLLVRARISLAEAADARLLSCEEVRIQLGEAAEGLAKVSAPARRHIRGCDHCRHFRNHLRSNNRVMAAVFPVGLIFALKKLALAKVGLAIGAGGAAGSGAAGSGVAGGGAALSGAVGGAGAAAGGSTLGTLGLGALGTKAAAGVATAALLTAGAVEVKHVAQPQPASPPAKVARAPASGGVVAPVPSIARTLAAVPGASGARSASREPGETKPLAIAVEPEPAPPGPAPTDPVATTEPAVAAPVESPAAQPAPPPGPGEEGDTQAPPAEQPPPATPGEPAGTADPAPAPPAGEQDASEPAGAGLGSERGPEWTPVAVPVTPAEPLSP